MRSIWILFLDRLQENFGGFVGPIGLYLIDYAALAKKHLFFGVLVFYAV
jgi:hypothetical protein